MIILLSQRRSSNNRLNKLCNYSHHLIHCTYFIAYKQQLDICWFHYKTECGRSLFFLRPLRGLKCIGSFSWSDIRRDFSSRHARRRDAERDGFNNMATRSMTESETTCFSWLLEVRCKCVSDPSYILVKNTSLGLMSGRRSVWVGLAGPAGGWSIRSTQARCSSQENGVALKECQF